MALTTLALVKAYAGVPNTNDDLMLQAIVDAVDGDIKDYTGRALESATFTITLNGRETDKIEVPNTPITAVSAVSVSGVAYSAAADSQGTGWMFDDDFVYLVGVTRGFVRGNRNVIITYTGGYAVGTAQLKRLAQAAVEQCVYQYKRRNWVGEVSKNLGGGQTVTHEREKWLPSVKRVIDTFVRPTA